MNLSSRQPGPRNGLSLNLFVNQADYLYAMSSSAGFRVWQHPLSYFVPLCCLVRCTVDTICTVMCGIKCGQSHKSCYSWLSSRAKNKNCIFGIREFYVDDKSASRNSQHRATSVIYLTACGTGDIRTMSSEIRESIFRDLAPHRQIVNMLINLLQACSRAIQVFWRQ